MVKCSPHQMTRCDLALKPPFDDLAMSEDPKSKPSATPEAAKPRHLTRREQLLAQAKLSQGLEPVAQRNALGKLIFEGVLSGVCTSAEIFEAAYDDPHGQRYWELSLFEPLPIYQFAEVLALESAGTNGIPAFDHYLLAIFERLRAAAEAGETWFIGDRSLLTTESWSSLALRNSSLAVQPQQAIAWMYQNPNARHLLPKIPAQIARSVSGNSQSLESDQGGIGKQSDFQSDLNADFQTIVPAITSVRRRGVKPKKLEQTKEKMRRDVWEGRITANTLADMLEKDLAGDYGVSRDTARKARDAILSEIVENSNFDK